MSIIQNVLFGKSAGITPAILPVANFSASATSITQSNSINFTDTSTVAPGGQAITSWTWSFEGGTPTSSNAQNPTITYNQTGSFNVSLTAANPSGSNTKTETDYIFVTSPNIILPVANFTADATAITQSDTVNFTDTSTVAPGGQAITSWTWSFVGGTPTSSNLQNPSVVYNETGSFDVSLTAANPSGSDTETKTNFIFVTSSSVPAFSATGGTETTVGSYTVHTFTSTGVFSVTGSRELEVFLVGGGGNGGGRSGNTGGGGGGGQVLTTSMSFSTNAYTISIGGAGSLSSVEQPASTILLQAAAGNNGSTDGFHSGGGSSGNGFSGGGGSSLCGSGGGGGGASANGIGGGNSGNSGTGGAGLGNDWRTGTTQNYGGGGGGGKNSCTRTNFGGLGGGGNGGFGPDSGGSPGTVNTGGGGGGAAQNASDGGSGGSGIVIIRYLTNP